jgi:hypothetical protein
MKAVIVMAILAATSISFATNCPSNMKTVASCKSTPKAGDSDAASQVLDSIAVCSQGASTVVVLEKNGESQTGEAKVEQRAGGVSYVLDAGDTAFALSYATGIRPQTQQEAQFSVLMKAADISVSSTYTCEMN